MAVLSKPVVTTALSPWGKAAAGAGAAALANILVYPLDLAKTRLQVQNKGDLDPDEENYASACDFICKTYASGGIEKLYVGMGGTILGTISTNFAYFYWYSVVRGQYLKHASTRTPTTGVELLLGALAGALAQLFTTPVSVVTTRQQAEGKRKLGLLEAGREVVAQDGIKGLWRGFKASLILVVNPSITYGSASRLRTLFFPGRSVLTVGENFILGAISKSLATVSTQPLIVAKVMQQAAGSGRRNFNSFVDALLYLLRTEGIRGMFKGLGPQLSKGILVQGLLLAFKDKIEIWLLLIIKFWQRRSLAIKV